MTFTKANNKIEKPSDEYARLLCSSGCGQPWSVLIDKPKCSRHQWGSSSEALKPIPFLNIPTTDGKDWARRIVKLSEQGFEIRPISLKFAKQALGIYGVSK